MVEQNRRTNRFVGAPVLSNTCPQPGAARRSPASDRFVLRHFCEHGLVRIRIFHQTPQLGNPVSNFIDGRSDEAPSYVQVAERYLKKGALVYLEGQNETRIWERDGQKHYTTEVVLRPYNSALQMLESKESDRPEPRQGRTRAPAADGPP